jgi:hypothetical protein
VAQLSVQLPTFNEPCLARLKFMSRFNYALLFLNHDVQGVQPDSDVFTRITIK